MTETTNTAASACAIADAAHAAATSATAPDIVCAANIAENPYKRDFPLLANHPDLAFLDSAATAQRPKTVLDAQRRFYEEMNANALRGLYRLSVEATEAIDVARNRVARFIGAPKAQDVVMCRNASEALNIVAKAFAPTVLEPGDEVCITIMEHHSNLIPWQQACRAAGAKLKKVAIILGARALFSIAFCMLTLAFLPFDFMTKLVVCILLWAPASAMGPTFTLWCGGDEKLAGLSNGITIVEAIVVATAIVLATGVAA